MKYLVRGRFSLAAILLLIIVWFFISCRNPIIMIEELKGSKWEQCVGKLVTVEGVFVKDPLPMLITNLKIVTVNTPMPYDQYLVLSGKEVDKINPEKYGGAKVRVVGNVKMVRREEVRYAGEKVVLEVLSYKILEVPKVPYCPKIQHMKPSSSNP